MAPRIRFKRPPIVEVVCGISFDTERPLKSAHVGAYWETIRDQFPVMEDTPPLPTVPDPATPLGGDLATPVQISFLPPLRRAWFLSADRGDLIQIQDRRFIFNWKRREPDDGYPSYDHVIVKFEEHFNGFLKFIAKEGLGVVTYLQFELVYVNQIDRSNGLGEMLASEIFVDHIRNNTSQRFLPEAESFAWNSNYLLPDSSGILQILAQASSTGPEQTINVRLDIAARGIGSDRTEVGRRAWFDLAHIWITEGFVDVTSSNIQNKYWGRIS